MSCRRKISSSFAVCGDLRGGCQAMNRLLQSLERLGCLSRRDATRAQRARIVQFTAHDLTPPVPVMSSSDRPALYARSKVVLEFIQ